MTAHRFCGEQDSAYRSLTFFIFKAVFEVQRPHGFSPHTTELD